MPRNLVWARRWLDVSVSPVFQVHAELTEMFRFYPSLASVSTHFSKYRATALGIAVAGSSIGMDLRCTDPRITS